ncbi:5-formyltetrahydrofolate cyclo-ligase, partial [bacterium]|nr:5-formyltetrahydrofolate cyclo-ligase [bacterium]
MPKTVLRSELLTRRRTMSHADWQHASAMIQQRLISLDLFQQAACIALYAPIQHEVDTAQIFYAAQSAGKVVLYPVVCGTGLRFMQITDLTQLNTGSFGIPEPCSHADDQTLEGVDLIIVPGVAFDLQGHRIGFGKGYYDRCLSVLSRMGVVVGLCHDFQLL